jgi:hypothetical protein
VRKGALDVVVGLTATQEGLDQLNQVNDSLLPMLTSFITKSNPVSIVVSNMKNLQKKNRPNVFFFFFF